MNRVVPIVLVLAGCASSPDKQAAIPADVSPALISPAVVATAPTHVPPQPESVLDASVSAVTPTVVAGVPASAASPVSEEMARIRPIPAEEVAETGKISGQMADTPWNDLMRRVTAWSNPLRRSMEPYCQDGQVRKP